jgi:GT2 family glycosyltransferase
MKYAIEQEAEYIIWLNDDCLPAQGTLNTLVQFLETHPNAIAGAACYLAEADIPVENGCVGRTRFSASTNTVVSVKTLAGYCTALPVSVCSSIGLPNEKRFPHYKGDDMYVLKATKFGFKAYILGDAQVFIQDNNQPAHNFTQYLKQRFKGHTSIKSVFFEKKSRYYLPTQLFYYIEKYNLIQGTPIFTLKFMGWFFQYFRFELNEVLRLN